MFRNRTVVIAAAFVIGILVLGGLVGMSSIGSTTVSAAQAPIRGGATGSMLDFALNFKKATGFEQFGANGMRNGAGDSFEANAIDPQASTDLENAVRAIGQLPCEAVDSSSLGGKTFGPGVYCLASADLAGSMTLDGMGDANARFVFRVSGDFNAAADSSIELANGAQSMNAFFVSGDSVSVGARGNIRASLIADGDIDISDGSMVRGKALSVKGNVNASEANVVAATGYIEVCKNLFPGDLIPAGTIFTFNVAGTDYQAPAGGCTSPIQVTTGNITVIEAVRANTAVVGIVATPSDRLVSSNFATRTAVVSVVEGDVNTQTVVTFTNQTTRTGVIEICKYALDTDVIGFFSYNVQGIVSASNPIVVPVGFCSPPITVTIPQIPQTIFTVNVTELAQANYRLENVDTLPIGQLVSWTPNAGFNAAGAPLASNTNGGYATVALVNSTNAALMTIVNFYNRSLPGRIKVCKITADPTNIPVGTIFNFDVTGTNPTSSTQTMPGVTTTVSMQVAAGPESQNGFCAFAPGTFIVGTPVTVTETGWVPPANTPFNFADNVRVSRIRALPSLMTSSLVNRTATLRARNTTAEVEFTNFIFRPAVLKICKTGGTGVTGNFTFTLALVNPLTSWPLVAANSTVTVPVGSCTFANGPFPATLSYPGIGTFNMNTQLNITESGTTNIVVSSPTGGAPTLSGRTATMNLTQNAALPSLPINEINFHNTLPIAPPVAAAVRYDFDGDGTSDMAIYRSGTWWYAASGANMSQTPIQFGLAGDKLVAADYDGDRKTDAAVYRNGTWFVNGSSVGMISMQFGMATDIPQTGDFDGDGKADFVVFRPSNGTWYMQLSQDGFRAVQFGISTDRPVAADFDGDNKVDAAVYRNGTWYVLGSTAGFYGVQFGIAGDIPVQADYDGDNKDDMAVYRGGAWYILGSTSGFKSVNFGIATDTPVPADYDGDGMTDIAVYRTSTTVWHILKSSQGLQGGYVAAQFGSSNDVLMNY